MRTPIVVGLLSLATGCGVDQREPVEPLARLDLRAVLSADDVFPVGLALSADGSRFIFDESIGLVRLLDNGLPMTVIRTSEIPDPGPTAPIRFPYTDIIAFAPDVFALTAIGDGYLLDVNARTLTQHFCYLPGEEGGGVPLAITQRTDAIALDAANNKIWAQPVTRDVAGTFIRAEVAVYDAATGADERWFGVPDDTAATAMLPRDGGLVLAQGSRLSAFFTGRSYGLETIDDLARFGVKSIDGMAIDHATNTLIVVDSVEDAVFDIDLAQLDNPIE